MGKFMAQCALAALFTSVRFQCWKPFCVSGGKFPAPAVWAYPSQPAISVALGFQDTRVLEKFAVMSRSW